jgi:pyrrolidone-carboxylate peptidase
MIRITAFGAFGTIIDNPSIALARALDPNAVILEVAYEAVDEWVERLDPADPTPILSLGVAADRKRLTYEVLAHNRAGATPDVRNMCKAETGTVEIDPSGYPTLGATFLAPEILKSFARKVTGASLSFDPGTYLCNYLHYKQLQRLPKTRVGFVHVVPFEQVPLDAQLIQLKSVLRLYA